jgi:hypothetical protein
VAAVSQLDRANKPITFGWNGRDKFGFACVIVQRPSEFSDSCIDCVLGVDEDPLAPDSVEDLGPGHKLSASFDQQEKQIQRNAFDADRAPATA